MHPSGPWLLIHITRRPRISAFHRNSVDMINKNIIVKVSFDLAEYTAEVDGVGTLRLLDAIRTCGLANSVRFYQVSSDFILA